MGPALTLAVIEKDVRHVASEYIKHTSTRGYASEFGVDVPSGQSYYVNKLDNQQPHCFPTQGPQTLSMKYEEFEAALSIKSKNQEWASANEEQRVAILGYVQKHASVLTKLTGIGVKINAKLWAKIDK